MDFASFGKRLKQARAKAGITQAQLAKLSGVRQNTISYYESGNHSTTASLPVAAALADALGVSLDWLCGRPEGIRDVYEELLNLKEIEWEKLEGIAAEHQNFLEVARSIDAAESSVNVAIDAVRKGHIERMKEIISHAKEVTL